MQRTAALAGEIYSTPGRRPFVGATVLVKGYESGDEVEPAVVTTVWSDECVNVRTLGERESAVQTSLTRVDSPEELAPGNWCWPPRVA